MEAPAEAFSRGKGGIAGGHSFKSTEANRARWTHLCMVGGAELVALHGTFEKIRQLRLHWSNRPITLPNDRPKATTSERYERTAAVAKMSLGRTTEAARTQICSDTTLSMA